ncbi:MAG: NAD(P)/FAD-dependent oxidoreductase [Syntrophaceae bacterium]|nr:NAD(P)/FAD-dependent oxidoreductase [Syntrophaceae bacterium]
MKVIIIGASLSGLFTAYLLAKEGVEVEVYDKTDILGWPPRTLIVTRELENVLDFFPEESIINEVWYIELFSRSKSARLELSSPDLVIERERLVKSLARLAEDAGTEVKLLHQFEGFAKFGKKVAVHFRNLETNEEVQTSTDVLVGADGGLSAVSGGDSRNGHRLTALLQAKVFLHEQRDSSTCQVWFDSNHTKYFYWLIPESEQTAIVGLIADDACQTGVCLTRFLQNRHLEPLEFQSAMVPMHRFGFAGEVLSNDRNIFVVGDAAAQVKVTTVGGVVTGLHGAKALAHAILNGRNYTKALWELKIELNLHLLIRQVLNRFSQVDYDELLGLIKGEFKDILEKWNRDELTQSFLRLIWTEPRLIKLGAKALLKSFLQ